MDKVWLVTITDGADFNARLKRKSFGNVLLAELWAAEQVAHFQRQRRDEGETDEMFIRAIHSDITTVDFDG